MSLCSIDLTVRSQTRVRDLTVTEDNIAEMISLVPVIDGDYSADSEAWARGTRHGIDVESSDETYHNNSKYYAEQARDSRSSASRSAGRADTSEQYAHGYAQATQALYNNLRGVALEGSSVTYTAEADLPVANFVVDVQGSYSDNGYGSVWVGGAGKNILPIQPTYSTTYSTVLNFGEDRTFSSITLSFTATNAVYTETTARLVNFRMFDGTNQYRLATAFKNEANQSFTANVQNNGRFKLTLTNITFAAVTIFYTSTSYGILQEAEESCSP